MIEDNITYEYITRYLRRTLAPSEGLLAEMEDFAKEYSVPISQPESIKLIEVLIRLGGVKRVLEVGTAIGYSAIRMIKAGAEHIDTIEINEQAVQASERFIARAGLSDRITVHHGDAREVLPTLTGSYDMIFIDAAKGQYNQFFSSSMEMLKTGGVLVSDNVLYKGMTATDELVQHRKITIVRRLREYLDMLCSHKSLDTAILPIGDGVAISYRLD